MHQERDAAHERAAASDGCNGCHGASLVEIHGAIYYGPTTAGAATRSTRLSAQAASGATAREQLVQDGRLRELPRPRAHARSGTDATHTATPFTAAAQGTGADGTVPSEGKECSTCHSAALMTAHATVSTSGGSVTCVECHTDTTLGSATVIGAGWPEQPLHGLPRHRCGKDARRLRHGAHRLDHARLRGLGRRLPRLHRPGQAARQEPVRRCADRPVVRQHRLPHHEGRRPAAIARRLVRRGQRRRLPHRQDHRQPRLRRRDAHEHRDVLP